MQTPAQTTTPRPSASEPPPEFRAGAIMKMDAPQLAAMLEDSASTEFQKMKACQRLAEVGGKEAVPALAAMLGDPKLAHYARSGLVPIPYPEVDDALRQAAGKLRGVLLVGVVNSIGRRQDVKAIPLLARMLYGAETEAARAAAAALGQISGPSAVKALQDAMLKAKGAVRLAATEASLVAAERLLARGDRQGALDLYALLSRPNIPKPVRLAAMHSIIATETSIARPRT